MLDMLLDGIAVLAPLAIAIMSVIVGKKLARDPQGESHKGWWRGILALGIICTGVTRWQQNRSRVAHTNEVNVLNSNFASLQSKFEESEIKHTAETRYVEGQLDAFKQMGPAMLKLAQASEENTRRQYEQKAMTNKQLRIMTADTVKKMRGFALKYANADEQVFNKFRGLDLQLRSNKVGNEYAQAADQLQNQKIAELIQEKGQEDFECRNTVLGDAVFTHNELLGKLGPQPTPPSGSIAFLSDFTAKLAFSGVTCDARSMGQAADYLEQLAKKLSP